MDKTCKVHLLGVLSTGKHRPKRLNSITEAPSRRVMVYSRQAGKVAFYYKAANLSDEPRISG